MKRPPLSLRDMVRKRAKNRCEKCGTRIIRNKRGSHNGSFHHRLPQRMGGINSLCNLVLLCLTCHKAIHRAEWAASHGGWIAWVDPEVTPVHLYTDGWVLLVPDGTLEYLSHQEGERLVAWTNGLDLVPQPA